MSNSQQKEQHTETENVMSFELLRDYFDKKFDEQNRTLEQKSIEDKQQLEKRLQGERKLKLILNSKEIRFSTISI